MADHWYAIINPRSGSGRAERHWKKISSFLKQEGIVYEPHFTQAPGHATDLARQGIAQGFRKIISVGGDGTAHEVANGILSQDVVPSNEITMALIPVGTGNDWGRTVGIPRHWNAAVKTIREGKTFVQDVGTLEYGEGDAVRHRYFVNIAGMGFEAFVGEYINPRKAAGKGGLLTYITALIKCLGKYEPQEATYSAGNMEVTKDVFSLACGICKYNGGGMKQCPDAIPDDGMLDLTVIHKVSRWTVIKNIARIFSGSFVKLPQVSQFRGEEFAVAGTDEPLPLEADGESLGTGPAKFGIIKGALKVVVR